jgi:hypothetical protein
VEFVVYPSNSTRPYEITFIAILMFCAGVRSLFSVREPWGSVGCGFCIVVGIGLLKLYQWARVVTIAVAFLEFGAYGVALLRQSRLIPFFTVLLGFLIYGYIVAYLSTSAVRLVFVRPVRETSAFAEKT